MLHDSLDCCHEQLVAKVDLSQALGESPCKKPCLELQRDNVRRLNIVAFTWHTQRKECFMLESDMVCFTQFKSSFKCYWNLWSKHDGPHMEASPHDGIKATQNCWRLSPDIDNSIKDKRWGRDPFRIFGRLAKLTSTSRSELDTAIDKSHPNHTKALEVAGLAPKKYPKLKGILNFMSNNNERKNRKNSNGKKRTTYFCIGVSEVWSGENATHVILKKLWNKCNLKWLRMSMSYHEFSDLGEIFQGNSNSKLMKNVTSKDCVNLDCNCRRGSTVNGNCIHGGECRKSIVMCKATCTECGCFHIGNAQQKLKHRMNAHFSETKQLVNDDVFSDSFAKHFAGHFNGDEKITRGDVRNTTRIEMLWQGEPILSIKTFKKLNCNSCARERIEIHKAMKRDKEDNTNSKSTLWMRCVGPVDTIPSFMGTALSHRKVLMTRLSRKS